VEDDPEDNEAPGWSEGLRERKKRATRRLISDTATAMFLEGGFDEVKVTDVAEACGVSEKTVYNYFPTKESLLLDREAELAALIWQALGPGSPERSPVEGALELLGLQLDEQYATWLSIGIPLFRRFGELVDATPSLRAAERDMSERLVQVAAEAMAARAGVSPDEPEPRIAATAVLGLWRIQSDAVRRHAVDGRPPAEARDLVRAEVRRAARLVESGLWSFGVPEGHGNREQLKSAAESAQQAAKQVATAVRQARLTWQQLQREAERGGGKTTSAAFQGLASFLEHTEQWSRDQRDQKDQWKRAYREQQAQLRQAQRELQRRFRQASQVRPEDTHQPRGGRTQ
jgi:AcrR family transcriptional regulator